MQPKAVALSPHDGNRVGSVDGNLWVAEFLGGHPRRVARFPDLLCNPLHRIIPRDFLPAVGARRTMSRRLQPVRLEIRWVCIKPDRRANSDSKTGWDTESTELVFLPVLVSNLGFVHSLRVRGRGVGSRTADGRFFIENAVPCHESLARREALSEMLKILGIAEWIEKPQINTLSVTESVSATPSLIE